MANPDDFLYEYAVVRYVPRVDREEFVNIGLLMLCKRRRWMMGKVEIDPYRILAFDPRANLDFLESQSALFMRRDVPSASVPVEERYRWLTAVKSAILQVSPSHPGVVPECEGDAEDILRAEFRRLFKDLVL